MGLFSSHRLRDRTIAAAQRAHIVHPSDPTAVQQHMAHLFGDYLDKKRPELRLDRAQTLLRHHMSNRTREEKLNFTSTLFAACSIRDPRFAAAEVLATMCDMARNLAHDQAVRDSLRDAQAPLDVGRLEKSYLEVCERERIAEAFAFYLARTVSSADMARVTAFFTHPDVTAVRARLTSLLAQTPEADPIGLDWMGFSVGNCELAVQPAGPMPGVPRTVETKARTFLDASHHWAVSQAGLAALCQLGEPALDLLLEHVDTEAYERFACAVDTFASERPGINCVALQWGLQDALHDLLPRRRGRTSE